MGINTSRVAMAITRCAKESETLACVCSAIVIATAYYLVPSGSKRQTTPQFTAELA